MRHGSRIIFAALLACGMASCRNAPQHAGEPTAESPSTTETRGGVSATAVHMEQVTFCGWPNAWKISNQACELIVVPRIGRIMSFRLTGRENVLWVNDALAGTTAPSDQAEWRNFGGEKIWPTQQDLWPKLAGRAWAPPYPFDGGAAVAEAIRGGVRLTTVVDSHFGAQVIREFTLDPVLPVVYVRQFHRKVTGAPVPMTLWSICQVRRPMWAMSPRQTTTSGVPYVAIQSPRAEVSPNGIVSIRNYPKVDQKIGFHAEADRRNGWVGAVFNDDQMLVMSHRVTAGETYPDKGCGREIYLRKELGSRTYVELELLGPFRTVTPGEVLADNAVWTLVPLEGLKEMDVDHTADAAHIAHVHALTALGDMASK